MSNNKHKSRVPIALLISFLSACTLMPELNPSSLPRLRALVKQYAPDTQQIQVVDMGQGQQAGGALLLKLNIKMPENFKTQDSESGRIEKTESDLLRFRVFLYQFSGPGPVPSGILSSGQISALSTLTQNLTQLSPGLHTQAFLLKNVPPGNYYVGIAAFEHTTNFNSTTNIGDVSSTYSYAEGPCFLTSNGGEGGLNSGRVTIGAGPNYTVTGPTQLSVNINLQDNIGAKLDTHVNIMDGTVFYVARDGSGFEDIFSVNVDGLPENNLTNQSSSNEFDPAIALGSVNKIAYVTTLGFQPIYLMDLDGSNQNQFTNPISTFRDKQPAWQPNGNRLAFVRLDVGNGYRGELYTITYPGATETVVYTSTGSDETEPAWSPDNIKIAHITDSSGAPSLAVVDFNGSNLTPVHTVTTGEVDKQPMYHPANGDGRILFASNVGGDFEIYTIQDNGSNLQQLTTNSTVDESAVWSPDGSQIAWVQNGDIWVMDDDGSNPSQLTTTGDNASPAWTADGLQILYKNGPATNNSVYMMLKNGKAKRRISSTYSVATVRQIGFTPN